jgi:heme exporter protein CcmD
MGYVIAAYGVTLAAILAYLAHLVRERRRLSRELGPD